MTSRNRTYTNSRYSFTRPVKSNGQLTKYVELVFWLEKLGPMSKVQLLEKYAKSNKESHGNIYCRGYLCSTFAGLRQFGLIDYNQKENKWFCVTENFFKYKKEFVIPQLMNTLF